MKRAAKFILMILLLIPHSAFADEDVVFKKLITTKTLKCQFGPSLSASWEHGKLKLHNDDSKAVIFFDSINMDKGTARMIANQGSSDVDVIPGVMFITFIEQTGSGNLIFTSVFPDYAKGTEDFISVTSRHINLPGGPLPSQYHGTCKIWE
jgi:hypothetical protein